MLIKDMKPDSSMCDYCMWNVLDDGLWKCITPVKDGKCAFKEIEESENKINDKNTK